MAQPPGPGPAKPAFDRGGTVLETDEDLRQALLSGLKRPSGLAATELAPPAAPPPTQAPVPPPAADAGRAAILFRPTGRPPVPILTVLDDGSAEGEAIRLREPRLTIGRAEGDLRFPLDGRMSARHVEIAHQVVDGRDRWVITDLGSTHGLFVRVSRAALVDGAEFLVGDGRYRFDANRPDPHEAPPSGLGADTSATRGWVDGPGPARPPSVSELIGREVGNRLLLIKDVYWIGSDPTCALARPDDAFCEPRHARLTRGPDGAWHAEHNRALNGLWLRMPQIPVSTTVQFQAGEQRFRLKVR